MLFPNGLSPTVTLTSQLEVGEREVFIPYRLVGVDGGAKQPTGCMSSRLGGVSTFFHKGKCASAIYEYPFWGSCLRYDSGKSGTLVDGAGLGE